MSRKAGAIQNNWTLMENMELLKDYYIGTPHEIKPESRRLLNQRMQGQSWISTFDLIHVEPAIPADDLYLQIVRGEVFFPLSDLRLSDQERALVFRDKATYLAFSTFLKVQKPVGQPEDFTIALDVDDLFTWDSETWQVINPGKKHITIKRVSANADESSLAELTPEQILALIQQQKITITPQGIKCNYRWFNCTEFGLPGVMGTKIPARYDPFNAGICWAFVEGEWRMCVSEHYAIFAGYSERAIYFATERLRLMDRRSGQAMLVNAERLAEFLIGVEGQEATAVQDLHDDEASPHRRRINEPAASGASLRFLPSAYSSAAASPYKQPERVLEALAALDEVASIWAETVGSGKAGGSVRQLFKARGFDYADDVSQTSKGRWGSEYTATYGGQEVDISPHITLGAKQPDTCLSIHWAWHKEEMVALVAHVGRHKTNTRT